MDDVRRRDGFRGVVTALTGLGAVITATSVGVVTGLAARATEDQQDAAAGTPPPGTTAGNGQRTRQQR